jgi:hypothetical protein
MMMNIFVWLLMAGAAAVSDTTRTVAKPRDALRAVLGAFDTHSAVLLGEVHYSVAEHQFIQRLIHDPGFPGRINDIAVEFANARYQPIIDRYIAGEHVPADSMRQVWENAIVPMAWDYPLYPQFFSAVRAINRTLPRDKRIRVLALDPPIPWDHIHATADIPRKWGYRDPAWVEVLEREVFARRRKVLVICGGVHLFRLDPTASFHSAPIERAGLGDALTQLHPGVVYSIFPVIGVDGIGALTRGWPQQSLADIAGTTIGAQTSHILLPGNLVVFAMVNGQRVPRALNEAEFPSIEHMVDALAYYGPDTSLTPRVVTSYRDSAYVAELHRRSAIVQPMFGQDLDSTIDSLAIVACKRYACGHKKPRSGRIPQVARNSSPTSWTGSEDA